MSATQVQILDACVLINLLASGEIEDILGATARASTICVAVERESIYLRTDDPHRPRELIQLEPLLASGLLTICSVEGDEEAQFYIDYASQLDDGEAMSLAIALARGYILATDERKAQRLFLETAGDSRRLTSTAELLRHWAESQQVTAARLKEALRRIETRARYQPTASDANYQWWINAAR